MNVKKIFITLGTVVGAVIIVAFALNILLPNVTTTVINATEDMIYNATGMAFDFNGDGNRGNAGNPNYNGGNSSGNDDVSGGVEGFN